jgi:hypothetical protein
MYAVRQVWASILDLDRLIAANKGTPHDSAARSDRRNVLRCVAMC